MSEKELNDLKSRVGDLRRRLLEAERELRDAQVRHAPFRVGDEVEARLGGSWQPAIVRRVEPQSWGEPWFKVSPRKKNGEWSSVERHAFGDVRALGGGK